jgi:hypothetical protein
MRACWATHSGTASCGSPGTKVAHANWIIASAIAAFIIGGYTFAKEVRNDPSSPRPFKEGCARGSWGHLPPRPSFKIASRKCGRRTRRSEVGFLPSQWKMHWSNVAMDTQLSRRNQRTAVNAHVLAGECCIAQIGKAGCSKNPQAPDREQ